MSESVSKIVLRRLVACALAGVSVLALIPSRSDGAINKVPAPLSGRATVVDGDTLDVAGRRVRLEGIDAPEAGQMCGRRWFGTWSCGQAATQALRALTGGRQVSCELRGTDKYGRVLGVCTAESSELNAAMVRTGMAWAFVKYSVTYVALEAEAKAARAGIWQGPAQVPWLYREKHWQAAEQTAPNGCAIKGNVSGKGQIYHMPWSPWYAKVSVDVARGERWFCSEAEAQKAGWRASEAH